MCIGDAIAQQTRRGLHSSIRERTSMKLSTSPPLTFLRWNFLNALRLARGSPVHSDPGTGVTLMSLGTILVILLVLILLGVIPSWGYSNSWGYGPSGIVGTILIIVVILLLLGRI
jgi:hypothetical protein